MGKESLENIDELQEIKVSSQKRARKHLAVEMHASRLFDLDLSSE